MRLMLAIIVLLLAGCAALPAAPRVEKVYIPVSEPRNVEIPEEPAWALDAVPLGAPLAEKVEALVREREQRMGYAERLKARLLECR